MRLGENVPKNHYMKAGCLVTIVVVFDIGGVLVPEGNRMEQLQDHIASSAGEFDRGAFADAYWAIRDEYDLGASDSAFWAPVLERAGLPTSGEIVSLAAQKDAELNATIAREPHALLQDLAAVQVPLAILSNAPLRMAQQVRDGGWSDVFTHLVFSSEHGCMKPDQRIYDLVVEGFSDVESPTFHFFDDREKNIAGANSAGWHGHLWQSTQHARTELTSLGVLPAKHP